MLTIFHQNYACSSYLLHEASLAVIIIFVYCLEFKTRGFYYIIYISI